MSLSACFEHQTDPQTKDNTQQKVDLAEVFRRYGESYRCKHSLPTHYCRVMRAIEHCRTRHMGGHLHRCKACGRDTPIYNPCGNRHCPNCQYVAKARWLAKRKAELLPVGYFHFVFTLPHDLNPLVLCNRKIMLDLLFDSVRKALSIFGKDPQWRLTGQIGFIAVLHTWTQTMIDHFHLHCIIPGGVLQKNAQWKSSGKNYLFRIESVVELFRNIYLDGLTKIYQKGKLRFSGQATSLASPENFEKLIDQLQNKSWRGYAKKPFAGPEQVLEYLGGYTHRVAISNHRIQSISDAGEVEFTYKDRKNGSKTRNMILPVNEFIRRFLLHVLPPRFMKIRYYGYLAHRHRKQNIQLIRDQLPTEQVDTQKRLDQTIDELTSKTCPRCPHCGSSELIHIREITSLFEIYKQIQRSSRAPPCIHLT